MRSKASDLLLASAALLVGVAGPGAAPAARAALEEVAAWPPASGTSVAPDSTDVMMAPIVADLDGDGRPEIVVVSFVDVLDPNTGQDGVLRILSGDDLSEVASVDSPGCVTCFGEPGCIDLDQRGDPGFLCPSCGVGVGDLDGDGTLEIVAVAEGEAYDPTDPSVGGARRIVVFDHLGRFEWCSEAAATGLGFLTNPAIADLDADGVAEIVVGGAKVFRTGGELAWEGPQGGTGLSVVDDLDADGRPEVILGERVHDADGAILWERPELSESFPAVGDFTQDCLPEVVAVDPSRAELHVLNGATGATIASTVLPGGLDVCPTPKPDQGGPPTLADVDGDCVPEIGVAGCRDYTFYRFDAGPPATLSPLWSQPIDDSTSRFTGSTIFDLDGDGRFEVLYNDHSFLWIFDALTGAVLDQLENSNATHVEYPTLADTDADGRAEIALSANDYFFCCDAGVRLIEDPAVPWSPTRPLMNQHSYHVTNVEDDGGIPVAEEPNWTRLNNYRVQLTPTGCRRDDCAPSCDAGPPVTAQCVGECGDGTVSVTLTAEDAGADATYSWDLSACCAPGEDCPESPIPGREITTCLPLDCGECEVVLSVTDSFGTSSCSTQVVALDDAPPSLSGLPADLDADCTPPPPPPVEASDACAGPRGVDFEETRLDGPCPNTYTLLRTWSAVDECGNETSETRRVDVVDDEPPVLTGVPDDETAACVAPPPPVVTADDGCDGSRPVAFDEEFVPGPCPSTFTLVRTWSAVDACGNAVSETRTVEVVDETPPSIEPPPPDVVVDCRAIPTPYVPSVEDACDDAPSVVFDERRIDRGCPYSYDLVRTWTATDACGNESSVTRTVGVRDIVPPRLTVPPPLVLECVGPEGVAADDPRVVAWIESARAVDDCSGPVPVDVEAPALFPLGCPDGSVTTVVFRAVDECGNETTATSTVEVVDTTPPVIEAIDLPGCLWSPNHRYWCVEDLAARVRASDACSESPTIFVEGCASDQPDEAPIEGDRGGRENGNGDGHHVDDCVVAPDGSALCLRIERQGTDPAGRRYGFTVVAVDACGNRAEQPWEIQVPHDQRDHPCRRVPNDEQLLPHEPFPWER